MFELSVACKYLIPRRRQLSVSIISMISIFVIALVVWLIVVFFSVTDGLEKSWIQKLTALTAPVRITPTDAYFNSYYYQIDSISDGSGYAPKTISEKRDSLLTDPYNPEMDEEIPSHWPAPDNNADGTLKDLVKLVDVSVKEIHDIPGLQSQDFELTATHLQLQLMRPTNLSHAENFFGGTTQSKLSYPAYLGNFEKNHLSFKETLLPIEPQDLNNLLNLIGYVNDSNEEDDVLETKKIFQPMILQKRLENFFHFVTIEQLKPRSIGWKIPQHIYPSKATWDVCAILNDNRIQRIIIPQKASYRKHLQESLEEQGEKVLLGQLHFKDSQPSLIISEKNVEISPKLNLFFLDDVILQAQLDRETIKKAKQIRDLFFHVKMTIQGTDLEGDIPFSRLDIAEASIHEKSGEQIPPWVYSENIGDMRSLVLPKDPDIGEGILLPKSFHEAGILIGDRGSLSYLSPTTSLLQEHRIPVYVAGFYDPGIIPIGGKFILANQDITSLIRSSHQQDNHPSTIVTNGINVRFDRLEQVDKVKHRLWMAFKEKGIQRYWNIETYREYEFSKEIMQELQSQKNLFLLIALVIIVVACSNIISMLIILVNDKKTEIGILRSMGASSRNIALIFGFAGALIGVIGSVIGIISAILTLHYFDKMISVLNYFQGHDMFSSALYGQVLPHELSFEALSFVLVATMGISLLAGIVPAIKACSLRPSHILRTSGG